MQKLLNSTRDRIFNKVHSSSLIYNTCWEDPRCDRELMKITPESNIVMITSAGCNALDYLLDNPAQINCIDVNPRQNALIQLKLAMFRASNYDELFEMFGTGSYDYAEALYFDSLRLILPDYAKVFWDSKIGYFTKGSNKRSFYFKGTAGTFAYIFKQYLDANKKARKLTNALLEAESLEEQLAIYNELEKKIFSKIIKWLLSRHSVMTMLGVPRAQRQLILNEFEDGIAGFMAESLRHVFTELPIQNNYFWHLYIKGYYTKENCPNYLKPENFNHYKTNWQRIHSHNTTIADFLIENPGKYSHFVLLDHQDWLAHHDTKALDREWELILKNSNPGTKILMRSAAKEITFLPDFVKAKVKFDLEASAHQHRLCRVGTYGSTYFGEVV